MPASHPIRHAALTDVGVRRSHNQDACASQPAADAAHFASHGHVFIVADGMGGHAVGEKASAKAVRDIPLTYLKHVAQDGPLTAIRRAFREANAAIYGIGQNNPEFKGLGTTGTALFLRPEGAWLGHVGDSRAYRIRGNRVQQLTFDHSWVWEVARRQGIDPDELGDFKKNVIIRSLGPDEEVEADVEGPHPIEPGDTFLMCSDGLSNQVGEDEIGAAVTLFPPEEACKYLVALANVRGGPDNITCLIAQLPGSPGDAGPQPKRKKGGAGKLARRLVRAIPWPFLALGTGAAVAGFSAWVRSQGMTTVAVLAFLVAATLILIGLVGLYLDLRSRGDDDDDDDPDDGPRELRVYRDFTFEPGKPLVDRFAGLSDQIRQAVKDKDVTIDWAAHDRLAAEADAAAAKEDWAAAFKARFLAVQAAAVGYNKVRQKDEAFQPNWTTKPSPSH